MTADEATDNLHDWGMGRDEQSVRGQVHHLFPDSGCYFFKVQPTIREKTGTGVVSLKQAVNIEASRQSLC